MVGKKVADFEAPATDGTFKLSAHKGHAVVLYFYPKDNTPGCTTEACTFRDHYEDFQQIGAEVIGISSDDAASHEGFANKHRLPFILLSDTDGAVRKAYGVPATLGLLPGRMTFVIDQDGVIRHIFNSQLRAARHVEEALGILKQLAA